MWQALLEHQAAVGPVIISDETFELLRIQAGTPVFGKDVTARTLPQEIGRDDRAISFVKGCYLGQETVARIDALGHVNQMMKGLRFEPGAPGPAPGWQLWDDGKSVGTVTSVALSPADRAPVALALIRISHAQAGTHLAAKHAEEALAAQATVSDLPLFKYL